MSVDSTSSALAIRLERLTGEDAACCVAEYEDWGEKLVRSARFQRSLSRARALADERRLLALFLVRQRGPLCACEIQAALGVSHATVSHHMAMLEAAGLVAAERRGKWVYYRFCGPEGMDLS